MDANNGNLSGSDETIIKRIREGDKHAFSELIFKYNSLINVKASSIKVAGAERDDLIQEGMIGLIKAVRTYKNGGGASFATYASRCVENQILSAVKTAGRTKHRPLNNYIPLEDLGTSDVKERIAYSTPEDEVIFTESLAGLKEAIYRGLSDLEYRVLTLYIEGRSYSDISKDLSKSVKSIDNALSRCKQKLKNNLAF